MNKKLLKGIAVALVPALILWALIVWGIIEIF